MTDTVRAAMARALAAIDGLQQLAEDIDDEWTYVNDLGEAWRSRLEAVAESRGDELLSGLYEAFTALAMPAIDVERARRGLTRVVGHLRGRQRFGVAAQCLDAPEVLLVERVVAAHR